MKKRILTMAAFVLCLVMVLAVPAAAFSGYTADVTIYGTYDYNEANEILRLVNEARAAEGKAPLVMDPALTRYAMQRAAEISVYYSHTRPDGSRCFTVMESTHYYGASGENIAIGYTSAADVTNGWLNSEGHYNNIMGVNYDFQTIGIGCFYQEDGTMCWVQLFSSLGATGTYNRTGTTNVSGIPIRVDSDVMNLHLNGLQGCSGITLCTGVETPLIFQLSNSGWEYASRVNLDGGYSISVADTTIAKTNSAGTTITGMKAGSTTMTVKLGGGEITAKVNVTVSSSPVLNCTVDSNGNHVLTWTDSSNQLYLFGKGSQDELWSLLAYPQSGARTYTNYYAWSDDSWSYVLRMRSSDGYYDVSDVIVVGDQAAPEIMTQPKTQKVKAGSKATFSIQASGSALSYQWQYKTSENGSWKNCTASGNKTATLKVDATTSKSAYYYRCKITDGNGNTVTSNTARLYVLGIKTQPATQRVKAGSTAQFTVSATGSNKTYQWQYKTSESGTWKNCTAEGNKTATLKVSATTGKSGYYYRCQIKDNGGNTVYTNSARLYVLGVKTQPATQRVKAGSTATFTVSATGSNKTYQWQYKTSATGTWKNCTAEGNKAATLKVSATTGKSGYYYRCQIKDNGGNTVYTNSARLYVLGITSQPASVTAKAGATAKFTVAATGSNKTYQWQYRTSSSGSWKNTTATGCNTATLSVSVTAAKNGYQYRCIVKDNGGNTVYSNAAKLTVK